MDTITIEKTIIDGLTNNKEYYLSCKICWNIQNYSKVNKGDLLAVLTYNTVKERRVLFSKSKIVTEKEVKIFSPIKGYIFILEQGEYNGLYHRFEKTYYNFIEEDIAKIENSIGLIFSSVDDLFSYYYDCSHSVLRKDPYTNLNMIEWNNDTELDLDYGNSFVIDFIDSKCVCCINYDEKLHKGDCFSLLFNNGNVIDFLIVDKPTKDEAHKFTLYQEDIDLLMTSSMVSYRICYHNHTKRPQAISLDDDCFGHPYKDKAIHAYIKSRIDAIHKLIPDYQFPRRSVLKTQEKYEFNWCFVYLMRDDTNGYHKIGISNNPEYREKTLQSEKPSIEMLACKKYPTRKIAESIESALHTAYSQQRLRGEWFNLNEADVAAIIETLK